MSLGKLSVCMYMYLFVLVYMYLYWQEYTLLTLVLQNVIINSFIFMCFSFPNKFRVLSTNTHCLATRRRERERWR